MPYRSPLCRKYIEKSWWRRIGWTTSRVSPASSSSGVVQAYWCCIGTSGTFMPTIRPILGPHIPAQPGHRLARPDCFGDAICRNVEAAPDPVRIQNRHALHTLLRRNELGFEAPRGREPVLALEIFPPLLGLGDLYAPHLVATRPAVQLELHVAPDAVFGQVGHHLGRVGLEHEPGSVGGGPTSLEERSLIQDHHIPPAKPCQMLGHAAADDASPDDHNARPTLHTPHQAATCRLPNSGRYYLRPTSPKTPPQDGSHTDVFEVRCAWRIPSLYTAQVTQGGAGVKKQFSISASQHFSTLQPPAVACQHFSH